jgi:hypothetical protein
MVIYISIRRKRKSWYPIPYAAAPAVLFLKNQPCFCLCLGFSQITMMRPLRLMILHFSQMGFTLGLTFMVVLLSLPIVEKSFF